MFQQIEDLDNSQPDAVLNISSQLKDSSKRTSGGNRIAFSICWNENYENSWFSFQQIEDLDKFVDIDIFGNLLEN